VTNDELPPEIGALLASLSEQAPTNDPTDVIAASLAARRAAPLQAPPDDDEVGAFRRAVDDVASTLSSLDAADWHRPAVNDLTVGELVGHLIGTQQAMAAELGIAPAISESSDHIEVTRAAIDATVALSPGAAAAEFVHWSRVVFDHLESLDADGLAGRARVGQLVSDVRFLLIARVFELWTHDNDLRAAVGRPRVEPDADRLWMMTRAVMPLVRIIADKRVRIVLTGPGGGVWPAAGEEIGEVAVDSIAFCRRIANRLPLDEIDRRAEGDADAVDTMLGALAGLALD
jgi:uncharacterized protein (TIGR03083 family)